MNEMNDEKKKLSCVNHDIIVSYRVFYMIQREKYIFDCERQNDK